MTIKMSENQEGTVKVIVYYVSGHGYGHFTRSVTVMLRLLQQEITDRIVIRTKVSPTLFQDQIPAKLLEDGIISRSEPPHELDPGTVQRSPLDIDPPQTLVNFIQLFHDSSPMSPTTSTNTPPHRLVQLEQDFLQQILQDKKNKLIAVLCDASPLGLASAKYHSIPGILISNFDWATIMDSFLSFLIQNPSAFHSITTSTNWEQRDLFLSQCHSSIRRMKDLYSCATAVLRPRGIVPSIVPYHTETSSHEENPNATQIYDLPWLCPDILLSKQESKNEFFSTCRQRLITCFFRNLVHTSSSDSTRRSNGHSSRRNAIHIVLVTFGGQHGKTLTNATDSSANIAMDETFHQEEEEKKMNDSQENQEEEEKKMNDLSPRVVNSIRHYFLFIYATHDAEDHVASHSSILDSYRMKNKNMNHACIGDSLAITSSQARSIAFGGSAQGSVAALTGLCDVLLCKPGYGTCAEAVAAGVTLIYVNREPEFMEEKYLMQEMGPAAIRLDRCQFDQKLWYDVILQALQPDVIEDTKTFYRNLAISGGLNGADKAAEIIRLILKL